MTTLKPNGGPEIPWDSSFVDMIGGKFGTTRDVPPAHPGDNLSYVSDEEVKDYVDRKTSRNLLTFGKYRCAAALFDISKSEQLEAYEAIQNNALHKGWIIAVEERNWSQEGASMIIFLKYMIPTDKDQTKTSP